MLQTFWNQVLLFFVNQENEFSKVNQVQKSMDIQWLWLIFW